MWRNESLFLYQYTHSHTHTQKERKNWAVKVPLTFFFSSAASLFWRKTFLQQGHKTTKTGNFREKSGAPLQLYGRKESHKTISALLSLSLFVEPPSVCCCCCCAGQRTTRTHKDFERKELKKKKSFFFLSFFFYLFVVYYFENSRNEIFSVMYIFSPPFFFNMRIRQCKSRVLCAPFGGYISTAPSKMAHLEENKKITKKERDNLEVFQHFFLLSLFLLLLLLMLAYKMFYSLATTLSPATTQRIKRNLYSRISPHQTECLNGRGRLLCDNHIIITIKRRRVKFERSSLAWI